MKKPVFDEKMYQDLWIEISGSYLSDTPPEDFFTWDDDKQLAFLGENQWEPFEYYDGEFMWETIENATYSRAQWMFARGLAEDHYFHGLPNPWAKAAQ